MQQKYSGKFNGITLEQNSGEGYGSFFIKGKYFYTQESQLKNKQQKGKAKVLPYQQVNVIMRV